MSQDLLQLLNSLSAESFHEVCKTHHVNSWFEEEEPENKCTAEWLEAHKPPPVIWSDEFVANRRKEQKQHQNEEETKEKQTETKTYASITKTSLTTNTSTSTKSDSVKTESNSKDNSSYTEVTKSNSWKSHKEKIIEIEKSISLKRIFPHAKHKTDDIITTYNNFDKLETVSDEQITQSSKSEQIITNNSGNKIIKKYNYKTKEAYASSSKQSVAPEKVKTQENTKCEIDKNSSYFVYWKYFTKLIYLYQLAVHFFHNVQNQFKENMLVKMCFFYFVLNYNLVMFVFWVYIVYKLMKLIYDILLQ